MVISWFWGGSCGSRVVLGGSAMVLGGSFSSSGVVPSGSKLILGCSIMVLGRFRWLWVVLWFFVALMWL